MALIKKNDLAVIDKFKDYPEEAVGALTEIQERYQEYYDGKSERWQESDKGEALQSWLSTLESVISGLEDARSIADLLDAEEYEAIL